MYQYEKVSQSIISMISRGLLREDEKIPSVRKMSASMGCSVNSVKEAYIRLEQLYYIYSKPKSGYYVRPMQEELQAMDAQDPSQLNPNEVSLCRIYSSYQEQGSLNPYKALGIAALDPSFYPVEQMTKIFRDTMTYEAEKALGYQIPPGYLPLREQIARMAIEEGSVVSPDEILITNGCHEAAYLVLSSLCKPGDVVAMESPCYYNLFHMLNKLGLKVVEIPASPENGIPLETLEFVLENYDISAFITVSNFSNPLGFSHSREKKRCILELLERFDTPMVEDSIYSDLYFGSQHADSYYSLKKPGQRVYLCSSLSKTLGPGLRTGWVFAGDLLEELISHKTLLNLGSTSVTQLALARYLEGGFYSRYLRKIRSLLKNNMVGIRRALLEKLPPGTRISNPDGGMALWVTLPDHLDTMDIYQKALKRDILIAPGNLFSQKRNYSSSFRICFGYVIQSPEELASLLSEAICS